MQDLVACLVRDYVGEIIVAENLLQSFLTFKDETARSHYVNEQQLLEEDERKNRFEEIEQHALQKIEEPNFEFGIDLFAKSFLQTYFHQFDVQAPGYLLAASIYHQLQNSAGCH